MNKRILTTLIVSTAAACTLAVADTTTITIKEPEVRTIVTSAGFGDPILVERNGDLWRVRSLDQAGDAEVVLFVNDEGRILSAGDVVELQLASDQPEASDSVEITTPVTRDSVALVAMNAGFHNVHDIDYLDSRGVWKLEADDISGEDYELHVNPTTGRIVHIEDD